jgi:hypothetical protein
MKKKTMYGNIVVIHNVLKKKNYKTKFSTSSILKKIDKDNFKKNTKTQKNKKEEEDNLGKKTKKKTCKAQKKRGKRKK